MLNACAPGVAVVNIDNGYGAGHLAAQAVAIVLATPFSFAANKLWAFAAPPPGGELQPVVVPARRRDS